MVKIHSQASSSVQITRIEAIEKGSLLLLFRGKALIGLITHKDTVSEIFASSSAIKNTLIGEQGPFASPSAKRTEKTWRDIQNDIQKTATKPYKIIPRKSPGKPTSTHCFIPWDNATLEQIVPEVATAIDLYCATKNVTRTP